MKRSLVQETSPSEARKRVKRSGSAVGTYWRNERNDFDSMKTDATATSVLESSMKEGFEQLRQENKELKQMIKVMDDRLQELLQTGTNGRGVEAIAVRNRGRRTKTPKKKYEECMYSRLVALNVVFNDTTFRIDASAVI